MKRITAIFAMAIMLLVIAATGASAAGGFVIPIDTYIAAEPGSITPIAVVETPPELVGSTCFGVAVAENGTSVHLGNNIIIESGSSVAVLENVEGAPNKVTNAIGELTLGEIVELSLLMGNDGAFSGGIAVFIDADCTPPTTVPPTTVPTTTVPTTTVPPTIVPPGDPVIDIVKTADPVFYDAAGIGYFTIEVHNPGPLDLTNVYVTDEDALTMDPNSDCPAVIGDLAVGETVTYECSVANLNGVSPFDNEATSIGTGPNDKEVTDTAEATVFAPVQDTTVTTAAPTTTVAPTETLPATGVPSEQLRNFGAVGMALVLAGLVLLSGAAALGQSRKNR